MSDKMHISLTYFVEEAVNIDLNNFLIHNITIYRNKNKIKFS